jgi:hypothetical protein
MECYRGARKNRRQHNKKQFFFEKKNQKTFAQRNVARNRAGDRIETRVIVNGPIEMAPPGIVITVEQLYPAGANG